MTPPRKPRIDPADPDTTTPASQAPAPAPDDDDDAGAGATTFAGGIPVDPGTAYSPQHADDQAADDPSATGTSLVVPQLVTHDQAVLALRALWGLARVGVKLTGGGPADAFQPAQRDLYDQAEPLVAIANRYPLVAMIVAHSDYAAAAILIGGYAAEEVQRVGEHRAGQAEPAPSCATSSNSRQRTPPHSGVPRHRYRALQPLRRAADLRELRLASAA
jgi:hypothetical protein